MLKNIAFFTFALLLIFWQGLQAQERFAGEHIKVKVDRVIVPITVTDELGGVVTNLGKESFEIFEDKKPQNIISLESTDSEVSIGIIFDISGSMEYKLSQAAGALIEFMKTSNPRDEFLLITFNDGPHFNLGFTQNELELQKKLAFLEAEGSTALLDAVYLGAHEIKKGKYSRKALLIISDGGDNHSRYSRGEIRSFIKESDVIIYAIGIYDSDPKNPKKLRNFSPFTMSIETRVEMLEDLRGVSLLDEISRVSGGKLFRFIITQPSPDNLSLSDMTRQISLELRNQHLLTYRSTNETRDGKWRKIKVGLTGFSRNSDFIIRHKERRLLCSTGLVLNTIFIKIRRKNAFFLWITYRS